MAELRDSSYYREQCNANPFPNENVDPKVKETKEFGLKVAQAIYWKGQLDESVFRRRSNIEINRLYAQGRQDRMQYRPILSADLDNAGDKSFLNISWDIESPAPLIVKRLIGRIMNVDFKIKAQSIDVTAQTSKSKQRDDFYGKMIRQRDAKKLEQMMGVKLENPKGFVPKDEDELDMYMENEYRVPIEIAFEELEEYVFRNNKYDNEIKTRVLHDLVENNLASVRLYYDENFNIRQRYVDIANLIRSYTNDPFHNDVEYVGEMVMLTIREVRKRSKGTLTEQQLFDIAKMYSNQYMNPRWDVGWGTTYNNNGLYNYDDFRIPCLDFVFYTTDVYKYEKKQNKYGGFYFNKKAYSYNTPQESKYNREMVAKQLEMEYEGLWVVGSEYIVQYGRSKNITRESKSGKLSPKVLKKFLIVEPAMINGVSQSCIEQIRPNLDMIQLSTLRKRHLLAVAMPPGIEIDWDALLEAGAGLGEKPKNMLKLAMEKGILFRRSRTDDGQYVSGGRAVSWNANGIGDAAKPYMEIYFDELNKIFSLLGLNTPADASQPDKRTLVGLEKMALIESNNATRELFEAYIYGIYGRAGQVVARMIKDQIKYGDGMTLYADVIGELLVKHLEFIPEDIGICDIGIEMEAMPDYFEVQDLLQNISDAMKAGEISYEDSLDIKGILNTKRASRVLAYRKKKRKEKEMEELAQKEAIIGQREQASAMAAAEAEKVKQMAKAEAEIAVLKTEYQLKKELLTHEYETFKSREIDRKGYWKEREIEKAAEVNLNKGDQSDLVPDPNITTNPIQAAKIPGG